MIGIKGKNVLVTGASSGIGQEIAIAFAREGANVAINYARSKEGAEYTLNKIQDFDVKAFIFQADVSDEHAVNDMFKKIINDFGSLDILINNAAIQIEGPSHEHPLSSFEKVININLKGAFICAQKAISHFLEREYKGIIINISSPHEIVPKPGFIGYSVSKGGLRNLTRTLALEYAPKGIRVNSVAPGATITRINKKWTDDPEKTALVEKLIPLGYVATPKDIAPSVLFLASDDASYIIGITLFVDGGVMLYPSFGKNVSS
jgi:glucose 1-dehydrogenase